MTDPAHPTQETSALAVAEPGGLATITYGVHRPPEHVLAEARRAAQALKEVIDAKPKKVTFNGETYLEYEDWQTVGRFYGIAPRILAGSTRYVEYGEVKGWEATAEAVHIPTGTVISTADAMCLNDEEHWRARPKYEWHYVKKTGGTSREDPGRDELVWEGPDGKRRPKKVRVHVGDEPVPLFQLRSMAQTRAAAKAMRNALAWVVVLAGYKPTPAEELPTSANAPGGGEVLDAPVSPGPAEPTNGHAAGPGDPAPAGAGRGDGWGDQPISEAQGRRLFAIARGQGWTEDDIYAYIHATYGYESPSAILRRDYEAIVDHVKATKKGAS